jgi:hypothetical protein
MLDSVVLVHLNSASCSMEAICALLDNLTVFVLSIFAERA